MKARISKKDGKIYQGREQLAGLVNSLRDGEYIVSVVSLEDPHTVEEWRKLYFFLRDTLHESVETGYTKKELHDVIKEHIFPAMIRDAERIANDWFKVDVTLPDVDDFKDNADPLAYMKARSRYNEEVVQSTSILTETGWREYVKRFKELAQDMWEVYI